MPTECHTDQRQSQHRTQLLSKAQALTLATGALQAHQLGGGQEGPGGHRRAIKSPQQPFGLPTITHA